MTDLLLSFIIIMKGVDPMGKRIKTSITIDEDVWTEAKIAAVRRRISLAELLEESIREKLEREGDQGGREKG